MDLLYAQGLHQNNRRHIKPPFILGTEFAGVVTKSPPSSSFTPGTRVFGASLGSYADKICVGEGSISKIPEGWSNAGACAVGASGPVSFASLVSVGKVKQGETVLVLGATGGLGVVAVQIAKAYGAKVIAVVGSREKADLVRSIGADEVVSYRERNWEEKVISASPKREGVDLVYDAVGEVQSSLKCLKYGGRVVIVGFAGRDGNVEEVKMNRILLKAATVVGYVSKIARSNPADTSDNAIALRRTRETSTTGDRTDLEELSGACAAWSDKTCDIRRKLRRLRKHVSCPARL